ncbi:MAG: transcription antitermination factor NusB [Thermovirgaceae bacterium]|nr:transcription antitermination factor NusB [Synergistales bacterium]HPC75246.1 transcription antitermination factor NusB [Synergistales bacterium]HRU90488.1 transcription antitermination factor NusB [Thermovirgaceae bacterium]
MKAILPQKRRRSREIALQILYSMDMREGVTPELAVELYPFDAEDEEVKSYAALLVLGVFKSKNGIDDLVRKHIVGWRPERMVIVDRVAIRLALYESVVAGMIPVPVAISEAVELSKQFGTAESGRFVNGVLGKIVRALESEEGAEKPHGGDPDRR